MKQMLMLKKDCENNLFFCFFYIGAAGGRDALKKVACGKFLAKAGSTLCADGLCNPWGSNPKF